MKKRADGRYVKTITDPKTHKRKSFYGETPREVNRKLMEYEQEGEKGKKFSEVAREWWDFEVEKLSPSTIRAYNSLSKHVINWFEHDRITEITTIDINAFLIDLAKKGYAKKSVKNHLIIISRIFHFAVVSGYIVVNPTNDVEIPRNLPEKKRHPATESDEEIIYKSADIWLLPYMALATGMRKGELIGLRWEDIDFENNLIYVRRSVWHGRKAFIKAPKTETGIRCIPIISHLREHLIKHKAAPSHYVFGGKEPMTEKAFLYRYKKFQEQTGITATAHQLRKSFATFAVESNVPPDVLRTIIGHKDISTTLNIYAEVRNARINEAAALFEDGFSKKNKA